MFSIPNCACADASVGSNVNKTTYCSTGKELSCLDEQRSAFSSSNCDAYCPETCERVQYSYKVSASKYPTA